MRRPLTLLLGISVFVSIVLSVGIHSKAADEIFEVTLTADVENIPPTVATIGFSSTMFGADEYTTFGITPNAGNDKRIHVTGIVQDKNASSTIDHVDMVFYRSGVENTCSEDPSDCYHVYTCMLNTDYAGGVSSIQYDCPVYLAYYADATDSIGRYSGQEWRAEVRVYDTSGAMGIRTESVEVNSLLAVKIPRYMGYNQIIAQTDTHSNTLAAAVVGSTLDYGVLELGATTTAATNVEMVLEQQGNVQADVELSGTDMNCTADGLSAGTIPVGNQKWSLTDVGYDNASTTALTSSPVQAGVNITFIDNGSSQYTASLFWNIGIPISGVGGTCEGVNTITVIASAISANGTVASYTKIASDINGEPVFADNDFFGTSVSGIGDLNNDGVPDFIAGANRDDTGGADRGAVYIFFMNTNGTIASSKKIASGVNGGPTLTNSDYFGFTSSVVGDLNNDSVPDLVVGAYGDDTGGSGRGAAYVLFMNTDGTVASYTKIASGTNGGPTLTDGDGFGVSVSGVGDLNNDTVPDIIVGAFGDDTGGTYRGAVYTLFMNTDGTVASSTKIASGTNGGPTLSDYDYFGRDVSGIGDLNNDNVTDVVVGVFGDNTGGTDRGAAYILFMNTDGTVASSTKIASGTNGGPTLTDEDFFGVSVSGIGDLNNDGTLDVIIGLYGEDTGGSGCGAAYILFMNTDGTVASSIKIASGTNGGPALIGGDNFGFSVSVVGDLNGDTVADIIVGAHSDDTNGSNRGAVYVLFMNTDGTVASSKKLASGSNAGPTLSDNDFFGTSVSNIGDFNNDGVPDLVVGAYTDSTGGTDRGAAYVLFMNTDGTVASSTKIASGTNGGPTLSDSDYFGAGVSSAGDLNGDNVTDLIVGAYGDNTGGTDRGATYVLFMNTDGTVASYTKIASGTNGGPTLSNSDSFGISVSNIGDLNNDGVLDLFVGAHGDNTGGTDRGAAYILFMNTDGTVASYTKIASGTNGGPTLSDSNYFGVSVSVAGDFNGDSVSDLVVGAHGDNTNGSGRGAVYVLFMNTDGTVASSTKIASGTNGGPTLSDADRFGRAVSSVGDISSDNVPDLVVGAHGDDTNGSGRGAVYALFMNADGTVASSTKIASGTNGGPMLSNSDQFGVSVSSAGDLNGDNVTDLVAGAYRDDTGGTDRGAVYILFIE